MTDASVDHSDDSLPFGAAADCYARLRFLPSAEALSWLLRGDENRVLDLAAGTGQVTGQLIARGLAAVAVEPDERMRAAFRARFPGTTCLDGTAERIPLPDDSLDACLVGSAWHWFDAPFRTSKAMAAADVVAWFRTHSTYLQADEATRKAIENRAARVLHEVFPGQHTIEVPVVTLCWRTERLPR